MKLVIQCASRKHKIAGHLRSPSGEQIVFVARPEKCESPSCASLCCRPDDEIGHGLGTWRDLLVHYNQQSSNPEKLYKAAELYEPTIYQDLVEEYNWQNVFILSAGWGLIRADYLTPIYDITFSNQGKPWTRRYRKDHYKDFNQLLENSILPDETVYFFGGDAYLPLYYSLTQNLAMRKVVYGRQDHRQGYEYIPYHRFTNWHYSCARDFIENRISK